MPGRTTSTKPKQPSLFSSTPGRSAKRAVARTKKASASSSRSGVTGKKTWLSATGLESMRRCPRCFWLKYNRKIRQPEGIVSRLANRFDKVIKQYFDQYRGTGALPPLIDGQIEGQLEDPFQEKYFATIDEQYGYMGFLDECVIREDGTYTPVDHKTTSSDPNGRPLIPAYQFQLDSYAWLLDQNRKPSSGVGHLVYFYPVDGEKLHAGFPMDVTVKTLKTDPSRVPTKINQAIKLLAGSMPDSDAECPFCEYVEAITHI